MPSSLRPGRRFVPTLLGLGAAAALAATAHAVDWPVFKPGLWTFERSRATAGSTRDKVTRTECADPTVDQQAEIDRLTEAGCEFTIVTRSGSTYRYSATCRLSGTSSTSESVLDVESDEAYTITIESVVDGGRITEVLRARRIGDCPE